MRQAMDYAADKTSHKRPLFWQMGKYCLSSTGQLLHFPCGTYREQMRTAAGRLEMELMRRVYDAERYARNRPSAEELFKNPQYEQFENWIQTDGWVIPTIERDGKQ